MAKKIEKLNIVALCDIYGNLLTDKQEQMLRLFYDYDNSLSEIAEQFGITRQGVHDSIIKAEEQLTNLESKLHLRQKILDIQVIISEVNNKLSNDLPEVSKKLEQITEIIYGD